MTRKKPVVLVIFDGWGYRKEPEGNAILLAKTPTWDRLWQTAPHTLLQAGGEAVGLPAGQMGNSEVGHMTMGAGRVIRQELSRISDEIENKQFFDNPILLEVFQKTLAAGKALHLMGLFSKGGVHSHEDHLFACLELAQRFPKVPIYIHAFLDGRDTPPKSAKASLTKLSSLLQRLPNARLATVCGRYYAMDRDNRWEERIARAFHAIVHFDAPYHATNGEDALEQAYQRQETDEFVQPTVISPDPEIRYSLQPGDGVIYINFRADRARALTYALTDPAFTGFERAPFVPVTSFVCFTEYDPKLTLPIAFPTEVPSNVLGEYLQDHHLSQCHIAETEKYAHVTFFFNGGRELPFRGEERILFPSPNVATYDLCPAMRADDITTALTHQILQRKHDFIVCNYANADMVGHTGNLQATIQAISFLDGCLKRIVEALHQVGGEALITADHGNADCMVDLLSRQPHTAHTRSLVPLVYVGSRKGRFQGEGTLADIAPTLLPLLGLAQPPEMTGHSLLLFQ